jgi:HD-like signal output (HDOD) protein
LAFTAGLLHDLGKTVFACALEHIYGKLVEDAEQNQACLAATEKRLLGLDHAQVGASLLARWGSPEMLVECVRFHHQPGESGEAGPIAACVYMGDMLAYFLDYACGSTAFSFAGRQQAQRLLGLSTSQFPYLLSQTIESMGMVEVLSR